MLVLCPTSRGETVWLAQWLHAPWLMICLKMTSGLLKKLSLGLILFFLVSNDSMVVFVEELGHFSLRNWNQSLWEKESGARVVCIKRSPEPTWMLMNYCVGGRKTLGVTFTFYWPLGKRTLCLSWKLLWPVFVDSMMALENWLLIHATDFWWGRKSFVKEKAETIVLWLSSDLFFLPAFQMETFLFYDG